MIPIFFNLQSHLWIAYLFFFNGLLLCLLLKSFITSFSTLTKPFEALFCFALVLSISLNGLVLFAFDALSLQFSEALWLLVLITLILLSFLSLKAIKHKQAFLKSNSLDWSYGRLVLYALIFLILFYNGGMIEQLSDAWWHMSLVNKIAMASSFTPELGHLTGAPARYYPPLWHANLALVHTVSSDSIPVLWNSLTAWISVAKVMAFYCLALALTKNKTIALGSAILFVLLPGIGNSYLRVSAWPSHVAYTVWYLMLAVFARIITHMPEELTLTKGGALKNTFHVINVNWLNCLILLILGVVINFTHKTELLWFCVSVFCYLCASSISRALQKKERYLAFRDHQSIRLAYRLILAFLLCIALRFAYNNIENSSVDQLLSFTIVIVVLIVFFLMDLDFLSRSIKLCLFIFVSILVLVSINYIHLLSLFFPDYSVPRGLFHESPSSVAGYFGTALNLPGWHLQLRSGLLYSGIVSIPLSVLLLVLRPSPVSLFVCGASVAVLMFCTSPYLYHWLKGILNYHSPWRIAVLVFHPIIRAMCLFEMFKVIKGRDFHESTH